MKGRRSTVIPDRRSAATPDRRQARHIIETTDDAAPSPPEQIDAALLRSTH
jgi:hypothetical protein